MPSAALRIWTSDRLLRLRQVDAHCATVQALAPPNPLFLDESLRGFVLHLSAHFQGFCRDLYTESSQALIASIPVGLKATAQSQFAAQLSLEKGNPNYDNIKKNFNRFGFSLNLLIAHQQGAQHVNDLSHLKCATIVDTSHSPALAHILRRARNIA